MVDTSRVAIIPARGGSKRIPKKNIIDFCGKPMIAWTIEAALRSGVIDRLVVSTDSEEIAEVALTYGAEVPFLRDSHADDHSPVSEAVAVTLQRLQDDSGVQYASVMQLMANCPLRTAEDIRSAVEFFDGHEADFQLSCFKYGWMNPWWAVKLDEQNRPQPLFPEALKTRSQDLPDLYCPTGAIWIAKVDAFLASKTFYGPGHVFCELGWRSAMDIDDHHDLAMAEALFAGNKR